MSRRDVLACALGVCLSVAASASGGAGNAPPDYSWEWATVGDPGNEHHTYWAGNRFRSVGGVDYEYRIATTQVTWGQYLEFANAYAPFTESAVALTGAGTGIRWTGGGSDGHPTYALWDESLRNRPAGTDWRLVARMANWLHNGAKPRGVATEADFETGAYDASTFGRNPDNTYTDQASRSEGARFWIPSNDEWIKAAYYDPNRHGEGEDGYWRFPNMTDDTLTPGRPEAGGETNAGLPGEWPAGQDRPLDVGSYDPTTPWGLQDASGGRPEWTETWSSEFQHASRLVRGTSTHNPEERLFGDPLAGDALEFRKAFDPYYNAVGFRFASFVPAPGTFGAILCFAIGAAQRRGRRNIAHSA